MQKKGVCPALIILSAAVLVFVCAFFLGRATLRGPLIETQRSGQSAAADAAQDVWIKQIEETAADAAAKSDRFCLNTAGLDALTALPGVGEKTAERILAYRDAYGKFVTVEQLLDVEGIGEGLLEKLRPYVYVEE